MTAVARHLWVCFIWVAVSGCQVDLSVPDGALILCASTDECPADMVCVETLGRCIRADDPDRQGPGLVDTSIQPAVARAGTAVRIAMDLDEPLALPPVIDSTPPGQATPIRLATEAGEGTSFTGTFVVDDTTAEGDWTFTAVAIDTRGNLSTLELGHLTVDRTPPTVSSLAFDLAQASPTALVHLSGVFDEAVTLDAVTLLDARNEVLTTLDPDGALTALPQGGVSLALDVPLDTPTIGHGDALTIELSAKDLAGNLTVARSPALLIDDESPVVTTFTTPDGEVVGQRDVALVIGGVGATQMKLAGDVLPTAQTFEWVPYATTATVTLTAGNTPKSLTLALRDEAGNESDEASLVLTVLDGPTLSAPTLSAPEGQGAVKNGDLLTIGGQGDAGASIVSARVVRSSDGETLQPLEEGEVSIDEQGVLSGGFVLTGAAHGESLAVEVVLTVRGRASLPASSRSPALGVDLLAPAPVAPTKVVLLESDAMPVALGLEDAFHHFQLEALDGATVDARLVRIYGDPAAAPLAEAPTTEGGGFDAVELPFVPAQRYHLTTVDHAGNESAPVTVTLPRATGVAFTPRPAKTGAAVRIAFTTNMRLRAAPEVTVDGRLATLLGGDVDKVGGDTFTFGYTPAGDEAEGPDAALVLIHLAPSTTLLAEGSLGFDAATASFDFTPPTLDALQLQQRPPGSTDRVIGPVAAVSDSAGGETLPLAAWPVTLEAVGEGGELYGTASTNADGSFSIDVGDNTADVYLVRARDAAGNEAVSAPLHSDRTPPVIVSLDVAPPEQRSGEPVTVTLRLRDDPQSPAPGVTLPAGAATLIDATSAEGDLIFSYSYTPTQGIDDEGINTIDVHAVDPAGNVETAQGSVRFDYTAPTSAPTTPGGQAVWNGNPGILGRAADEATGVSEVWLSVRDTDSGAWFDGSAFTGADEVRLPALGTTAFSTAGIGFVDGHTYEILSRAVDGAGNEQTEPGRATFTFDEDSLDGPIEPEAHSIGSGSVLVRWQAPAATTVESYRVYYADADSPGPPWSDDGATEGPSPVATTDTSLLLSGLPSKRYGIVVTAVHEGGVESPFSAKVEVDSNVWRWRNPALTSAGLAAVAAIDDETFVVVGGHGLVARSTDAGATWRFVESGVNTALKSLATRGQVILATHDSGMLRSSDAGLTWTNVGPGASFLEVASGSNEPCPEAPEPCVFHAITQFGIYRSVDAGVTWALQTSGTNLSTLSASGSKVIVGTSTHQVFVSGNEGVNFTARNALTSSYLVQSVYTDGERWYASGLSKQNFTTRLTRYSENGSEWTKSAISDTEAIHDWLHVDDSLLAVTSGGIYQSTNGGVSFTRRLTSSRLSALCPGLTSTLSVGQNLYRSTNLTSWTQTDPEVNAGLNMCTSSGGNAVAIGNSSLWRSADDGASWSRVQAVTVHQLHVVHRAGQRAFTAGKGGVAYSSDDGGKTWSPADVGNSPLTTFAADGDTWVVAGAGVIYRSEDAGVTWSAATGTGSRDFSHVFGHGGTFVAASDEGLRRSEDGGKSWTRVLSTLWPVNTVWGAGGTWIAAGDSLLVISEDDGRTWTDADGATSLNFRSVMGHGETLVAGADGGRVKYRLDASSGWQTASVTREAGYNELNFHVSEVSVQGWHTPDGVSWVGVSSNGTVRTSNLADGFIARGGPVSVQPHSLPVTIAGNGEFVAITTTNGVYYSRDLGASWHSGSAAIPLGFSSPNALWVGDDGKALAVGGFSMIVSLDLP